jgi:hypothetical protein
MKKIIIISFLITLFFSSCNRNETLFNEVIVHDREGEFQEIELKIKYNGQGPNIHNFTWDKYDTILPIWIYVTEIHGRVYGENIRISPMRGFTEINESLKGYIDFDSTSMIINLQQPHYPDGYTLDHYEPSEYNGTYQLKFNNDK